MSTQNLFGDLNLEATQQDIKAAAETIANALDVRDSPADANQAGLAIFGIRRDTDGAVTADGDLTLMQFDEAGRLKTASQTASFPDITGNATAVGNTIVADVQRASNVVFHVKNTGTVTLAAGTFIFEASLDSTNGTDGTWFAIQAIRTNANTIEGSIALTGMAANAGYASAWEASVNAYKYMRLRCSVAVTANAIASWTIMRGSYATEPIPGAQASATQPVSGTVTANWGTITAPLNYNLRTAATNNAASIKASAGSIYELTVSNITATPVYVKFYNKTTAAAPATDIPILVIPVPANTTEFKQFGTIGKRFTTGISIAVVANAAINDNTNAVADVLVNVSYI